MKVNQLKILFAIIMVLFAITNKIDRKEPLPRPDLTQKSRQIAQISNNLTAPSYSYPIKQRLGKKDVPDPKLDAKAALVKELDSNEDFYRYNTGTRWPLASLTKLMSAVVAIEEAGLNKKITISESAVSSEGVAGDLQQSEQYNIGELLKLMFVVSSNDAAAAIAEFYDSKNFVDQMQIKASLLEMAQTTFTDPIGLSSLNQGTIEDLEKLVQYVYKKYPAIFKTSAQPKISVFEETKGIEKEFLNINPFAQSRTDFLGGKTGFTDKAGGNIISIFNYNGHKILIIVLGAGNKFEDKFNQTEILYNWIKSAYALD
jgi:D-alanyl-D-alanine carboxypeptidase